METIDDVLNYITEHAENDIAENKVTTRSDYSPAVGWLLERIVMLEDTFPGYMSFPMNIMFQEVPNLKEMIRRFGKRGEDRIEFNGTMKCAVAVHEYLESHPYDKRELNRRISEYGESLQFIDGNMYSHLDPVEAGSAYNIAELRVT